MPTIGELNVELSVLFEKVAPALATALQQLEAWQASAQKLSAIKLTVDGQGIKEGVQAALSLAKAFESVERAALHFGDALKQTATDQKNLSASTSTVVSSFGQVSSSVSSAASSLGSINSSATSASTALGSMAGDVARANAGLSQISGAASQAFAGLSTVGQASTQAIAGLQGISASASQASIALQRVPIAAGAAAAGLAAIPAAAGTAGAGFTALQRQAQGLQQVGTVITAAFAAPAAGIGLSIKAFADFDLALQKSVAVQRDIKPVDRSDLAAAAISLSKNITVSAKEAAAAFYPLQSVGFTVNEQIAALGKVAQFAKAGLVDMATASQDLTRIQGALGLATGDSASKLQSIQRVSDLIVKADSVANARTAQFAEALVSKGAPAIRQYGQTLEDGVAVLAAFAEGGTRGAQAGNFLAITLRELDKGFLKSKSNPFFEQFGIAPFDAVTGKARSLIDVIDQMQKHFRGLSDEQKLVDLGKLLPGSRSLNAILPILNDSERGVRFFGKAMQDVGGITKEVSDNQMKAFGEQLKLLLNRAEALKIILGDSFGRALQGIAKAFEPIFQGIEGAVAAFARLPEGVRVALASFALIGTGAGLATGGLVLIGSFALRTVASLALLSQAAGAAAGSAGLLGGLTSTLSGMAGALGGGLFTAVSALAPAIVAVGVAFAGWQLFQASREIGKIDLDLIGLRGTVTLINTALSGTGALLSTFQSAVSNAAGASVDTIKLLLEKTFGSEVKVAVSFFEIGIQAISRTIEQVFPHRQIFIDTVFRTLKDPKNLAFAAEKTESFVDAIIPTSTPRGLFALKDNIANVLRPIQRIDTSGITDALKVTQNFKGVTDQANAAVKKLDESFHTALRKSSDSAEAAFGFKDGLTHVQQLKKALDELKANRAAGVTNSLGNTISDDEIRVATDKYNKAVRAEGSETRRFASEQESALKKAAAEFKLFGAEINDVSFAELQKKFDDLIKRFGDNPKFSAAIAVATAKMGELSAVESGPPDNRERLNKIGKTLEAPLSRAPIEIKTSGFEELRLSLQRGQVGILEFLKDAQLFQATIEKINAKKVEDTAKAFSDFHIDPSLTDDTNKKLDDLRTKAQLVHDAVSAGTAKPEAAAVADEAVRKEASGENALKAAVDKTKGELKRLSDAAKTAVDDGTFQDLYIVLNNLRDAMSRGDVGSASTKDFAKGVQDFAAAADIRNGIPGLEKINQDLEKLGVKKNDEGLQDQIKLLAELKRGLDAGRGSVADFNRAQLNVDRGKERAVLNTPIQDALKTEGVKSTLSLHIETGDAVATWQDALSHIGDATGVTQKDVNQLWVKMIEAQARETGRLPQEIDSSYSKIKRSTQDVVQQGSEAFRAFGRQVSTILTDFGKNVVDILIPKSSTKPLVRETAAVADFAIQTGLSGDALESLVKKLETLTTATGGSFGSIAKDAAAEFKAWGVATKDQAANLDAIFATAVAGKTNFSELLASVSGSSATFQALGLNVTQAAALIAQLNLSGSDSKQVVDDLTKAYQDLTSKGYSNAGQALQQVIGSIKNAGSVAEANAISIRTFGTNGVLMATLIRSSKLDVAAFTAEIAKTPASVDQAKNAVNAFAADAGKLGTLSALFNEVGRSIARAFVEQGAKSIATFITETLNLNGHLKDLLHTVVDLIGKIPGLGGLADVLHKAGGFGSVSGPVAPIAGQVATATQSAGGIFGPAIPSIAPQIPTTSLPGFSGLPPLGPENLPPGVGQATQAANDAGKAASQASTAASQTAGVAGSAASSASSLLGTISQVSGIVTGIGTLISSVIGNFQQAAANKKLGGIETATTRLDIATTQGSLSLDPELKGSQENLSTFAKASYLVQRDLRDRLESLRSALFAPVNETLESIDRHMAKLASPSINVTGLSFDRLDGYAAQGVDYLKQIAASVLDLSGIVNAGAPRLAAAGVNGASLKSAGGGGGDVFNITVQGSLSSQLDVSSVMRQMADTIQLRRGRKGTSR